MLLVVESSEDWTQYYKTMLGESPLDVYWARNLGEARRYWHDGGSIGITTVILDERIAGHRQSTALSFAHEIIRHWEAHDINGALVVVAETPALQGHVPPADCIHQELKCDAISAVLRHLYSA